MTDSRLRIIREAIDSFWMTPQDLRILEVLRRFYGLLLLLNTGLLWIDRRVFFGKDSFLPAEAAAQVVDPDTWSLFSFAPESHTVVDAALLVLMAGAGALIFGKIPRSAAALCFVLLVSIHHANIMLFDAEDTVFRLFCFFLIFVPPWSQLNKRATLPENGSECDLLFPAWPLRLFQIQVCLIYFCSAIQKSDGQAWLDGTALYYALRLDDATRFALPEQIVESAGWIEFLTWSVVVFEFVAPVLIWWPKARWSILIAAFSFHLGTDYSMNLHLFHWIMMAGLFSFIRYDELCKIKRWLRIRRGENVLTNNETRQRRR